jgi:hypothetical protein
MPLSDFATLNRRVQNSVFAALIIITATAIYSWLVNPHIKDVSAAQSYDSALDMVVEKNRYLTNQVQLKKEKLQQLTEQYTQSRNNLFTPAQAKEFFGDLQVMLEETDCTVHSLNLVVNKSGDKDKQIKNASGIDTNSAALSVSGQYGSITRLVEGLQSHSPKVWLDSFVIELMDYASGLLKCDMTITIYTIEEKGDAL